MEEQEKKKDVCMSTPPIRGKALGDKTPTYLHGIT